MVGLAPNQGLIRSSAEMNPPIRLDGRSILECRELSLHLGPLNGQSEVRIGKTVVATTVTGEIVSPLLDRPNEGRFFFNIEISDQHDSVSGDNARSFIETTSTCNYVERVLRGSKAIDTESLCILGGKSVWSIRIDMHILCSDGGLLDACSIGALTGLLNFRHESVNIVGDSATVFKPHSREPVHLSLHHLPVSTSFSLFESNGHAMWMADPSMDEESALESCFAIACNQHGEMCGFHKFGGLPIGEDIMNDCLEVAVQRARYISDIIRDATESSKH